MATVPLPYDAAIDAPDVSHTPTAWDSGPPVATARFGTWVFLASEAFFFGGLVAAYIVLRSSSTSWIEPLDVKLGLVLTALLVASSLCAGQGVRRIRAGGSVMPAGARAAASNWLLLAACCALAFLGVQAFEWRELAHAGFTPRGSLAGASFYVLTGAHGLHVLGGVLWLATSGVIVRREGSRVLHAELAALYQHFVDAVWLALLVLLYWI